MISAFVITADDDPAILRATLAAARWVDELVLVDKSKKKPNTYDIASNVDEYFEIEWSPTVEETRAFALDMTEHEWVVCLDADEILSPACEAVFRAFVADGSTGVLFVPIHHYLLGREDQRSLSWPEWRPCLFRRGAVEYGQTVHAGTRVAGTSRVLDADSGAFLTHLSSPDVATYVEKINRYTSRPERSGVGVPPAGSLREWAAAALQTYVGRDGWGQDDYCDAAALLRGLYDVVDGLKRWEATQPNAREVYAEMARDVVERCSS